MKVKELIEELSELDPELDIVISKDSEGNIFNPVFCVTSDGSYYEEETKDLYLPEDLDDDFDFEGMYKVAIIWP